MPSAPARGLGHENKTTQSGKSGQAPEFRLPKDFPFPLENLLGRRPAHPLMGLVHAGEQANYCRIRRIVWGADSPVILTMYSNNNPRVGFACFKYW